MKKYYMTYRVIGEDITRTSECASLNINDLKNIEVIKYFWM